MNEALKKNEKYQKRYMKRHKMLCVLLSNENDKDIINWLRTQENASESVRRVLRSNIEYQDMTNLSRRFETHLVGDMKFGDEVLDEHGDKAVVVKGPYPVGRDRERFVTVYSGHYLSSAPVKKFRKTGKSYANELNTIFEGLKEEK